jgi:hypothetical protein
MHDKEIIKNLFEDILPTEEKQRICQEIMHRVREDDRRKTLEEVKEKLKVLQETMLRKYHQHFYNKKKYVGWTSSQLKQEYAAEIDNIIRWTEKEGGTPDSPNSQGSIFSPPSSESIKEVKKKLAEMEGK